MSDKQFEIDRWAVYRAYESVKRNKGSAGCDQVGFEAFERDLKNNLYKLWNRMSSGSYFPSPVLAVQIPKKNGKMRTLGIPTIEDRVAQMTALAYFEPCVEPLFEDDSYGYRPGKSALDAVGKARERCWQYDYVIELDIKGLFDNIDHELLMRAVDKHVKQPWVRLYITRWLTAPFIDHKGNVTERTAGTPQGGVISPVLANLFMHYAFDLWMKIHHPEAPFERYADDALIHCRTREEAETLKAELADRFAQCKLEMNQEKTRIAYCKDSNRTKDEPITEFDFLGYTFKRQWVRTKGEESFMGFNPVASKKACKAFRDKIKGKQIQRWSAVPLEVLAQVLNPVINGWCNYFGRYRRGALKYNLRWLNGIIVRWAMRKFKNLRGHPTRAYKWLDKVRKSQPGLFAHWKWLRTAN